MELEPLYIRQTGLIDPRILTHKIAIIGAGSIGGWTTLCLGKLGCQDITVFDFDTVEIHNAGSQVFKSSDVGRLKTTALQERMRFLLEKDVSIGNIRWNPRINLQEFDIVIAAVDSITPRKELFEHLMGSNTLYIDARMAGNAIEIYTTHMNNAEECKRYEETLFDEADTLPVRCSEKSVVYNVFVVAGMIGDLVAKHANEKELPREMVIDLENLTLFK